MTQKVDGIAKFLQQTHTPPSEFFLRKNGIEFPIDSIEKLETLDKLVRKSIKMAMAVKEEVAPLKPINKKWAKTGLARILTDEVIHKFNWFGVMEKPALNKFRIFSRTCYGKCLIFNNF
jgi:Domain of unknown function (DUF4806)